MGFFGDLAKSLITPPSTTETLPTASSTDAQSHSSTPDNPFYDAGRKIIPEIEVVRLEPHESGNNLELWAHIKNLSQFEIEVTKIAILGQTNTIGRFLDPGEQHEVRIYRGTIPTNEGYKKCEISFKLVRSGDYFCADHRIDYDFEDGKYIPTELHVIHPIRDV